MKKGFPADISTLGGRVRQSRLDAGHTIKDFSAMLGISANHLGLVERGEKQPSYKLLQKVSELSGVPYQWIAKGTMPAQTQAQKSTDAQSVVCQNLNLRLFFGLILTLVPSVSKEMLSNMLNISSETLDRILKGEATECDIQQHTQLSMLTGLLGDVPAIRSDLMNLDKFLADVAYDRSMVILKDHLTSHIYTQCEQRYKLHCPISSHNVKYYDFNAIGKRFTTHWTQMTLCAVENPNRLWTFQVLEPTGSVNDELMEQIVNSAADETDAVSGNLSIVFLSKSDFDNFSNFAERVVDKLVMREEGSAAVGMPCSIDTEYELCNLSYILIDNDTWDIMEWAPFNSSCDIFPEPPADVNAIMS